MADSFKKATKKSLHEAKVAELDSIGSSTEEFLKEETFNVIEDILGDFIIRVKDNIDKTPQLVVTGKISELEVQAVEGAINVVGNKWLIYQDRGVNGSTIKKYNTPHSYTDKTPPVEVFKTWIKEKNIRLKNNKTYHGEESPFKDLTEDEQINSAAWGMAVKVFHEGFKPRNIFSKEIPKLVEDLAKEVANIGVQSILQVFDIKKSAKRVIVLK